MSCSLVTGLPRHGKSYYATLQILEELRRSKRYVVTNVPLDLEELSAFCDKWMPTDPCLTSRVRLLTAQETAEFYLYDPEGCIVKGVKLWEPEQREWHSALKRDRQPILVPNFARRQEPDYPGVFYVIDEAHLFFDAHAWQKIGNDVSFFISQHGHMRTDIMFVTQHPGKLAKRLKVDCEEYTVVTNLGRVKGWKGVTLPGWFMRETYPGNPDDEQRGEPEKGRFKLKAETIGKLYSTSAGVGLAGRVDTEEKKRGKHWSRWAISLSLGVVGALFLPLIVLKGFGGLLHHSLGGYFGASTGTMAPTPGTIITNPPAPSIGNRVVNNLSSAVNTAIARTPQVTTTEDPQTCVTGISPWGVCLDDGRTLLRSEGYQWARVPEGVYIAGIGLIKWKPDTTRSAINKAKARDNRIRPML